jgi:hypothetical protein
MQKRYFFKNQTSLNQKSYPQLSGKLFIGLTTKPAHFWAKTTQLLLMLYWGKKALHS